MVPTLKEAIKEAEEKKVAIGHFNISDTEALWAIFNSARKLKVPVIIGVSEGERAFIGLRQVRALVTSLQEEYNYPIYLNADHTYSYEKVIHAIDAGCDSVIFDGTKISREKNKEITKKCVEYAKRHKEKTGKEVLIEAEMGYIGTSSKVLDEVPEGAQVTKDKMVKPEEAKSFVKETGVDLLAPAVGNLHGMLKNAFNPNLDIERIKEIRESSGVPLVLHGGSGITDSDFREAIKAGISVVHINTEIRLAYRQGIQKHLTEFPDEIAPYRFMKEGVKGMEKVITERLKLFNELGPRG